MIQWKKGKEITMTKKEMKEYAFHIESAEFYQERAEEFRKNGELEFVRHYEDVCVALHLNEAKKILENSKKLYKK